MIKSKHFRKDVIIARVIFAALCIILIAGIIWLVSALMGNSGSGDTEGTQKESQDTGIIDSESESDSVSESESVSQSESASESESMSESESTSEPGSTEPEAPTEPEKKDTYVQVTAKILNLRAEPNTTSTVLTSLKQGDKVKVLEKVNGWYKVSYNGKEGYLSADYVKVVEE